MLLLDKSQCTYTSCYCEENVWKLCENIKNHDPQYLDFCYAVFISNDSRLVPLWMQTAGREDENIVIWDYHVIFVYAKNIKEELPYVYDLDSLLPFPCPFDNYISETFKDEIEIIPKYHRKFRVIPAKLFLSTFASDRSHMVGQNGEFMKNPPDYPCIQAKDCTNNIQDFISMDSSIGVGEILTLDQFKLYYKTDRLSQY